MRALAFSGGKDSLACWYLTKPTMVLWVNTGKAYPETRKIVDMVANEAEIFIEVLTDQESQNQREGIPSDVVPIAWTRLGQLVTSSKPYAVQSYLQCCFENLSLPLHEAAKKHGVTTLIRGQRNDESHRGTARHGDVVDGIRYEHPIETWTSSDVLGYLQAYIKIPEHFKIGHSSLDCYDCTAFSKHSADRVEWMKVKHPDFYLKYMERMTALIATMG